MKKRLFSLIMMCFLAISICLTGCGKEGLKDNPPTAATVFSNGGMSVIKGDYLYFVNGYIDETTLTKDDNKEGIFKEIELGILNVEQFLKDINDNEFVNSNLLRKKRR